MENDQFQLRKSKLKELEENGINPFGNSFKPGFISSEIFEKYENLSREQLENINDTYTLAGRIVSRRDFGKSAFFHIMDRGGKIQCFLQKNKVSDETFNTFKKLVDIGDFVGIEGQVFKTKTEELTININSLHFLTKTLRPMPEKWHGLQDVEIRYRQRYLDLVSNERTRDIFFKRSRIIKLIRDFLDSRDFLEVETPILQSIAGGAAARPFLTHHNTLDMELSLRIAPELYLKRLVVGGIDRVYELGRTFRNEGVSTKHNPEFTMIEFYQAYATYTDLMDLIEEMICDVTLKTIGELKFIYDDTELDFTAPWKRINIYDSLIEKFDDRILNDDKFLFDKADSLGIKHNNIRGKAITEIFELEIGDNLVNPSFVYGYPLDVSPLARKNDLKPEVTDRFELYIYGREIANAFSELNDPIDQKERFEKQIKLKEKGEDEYHQMDDDYVTALEYGMPPTAGAGIGIDRLVMLLTNSLSIREVIFFPHLKL